MKHINVLNRTKFGIQFFAAPGGMNDRLDAIDARMSAIAQELEKPGADLDALEQEVRSLKAERTKITQAAERRAQILRELSGGGGTVVHTFDQGLPEKRTYTPESAEYRSAWLRNLQGKALTAEERAAISAAAVIPTVTMNSIIDRLDENPIIKAISVSYIPSNISQPVAGDCDDGSWIDMGAASTDSSADVDEVTLGAFKLIKTVDITADVQNMSIDAFESWLVGKLSNKMESTIDKAVFTGTGAGQATGILKSGEITQTGTFTKAGLKFSDLTSIIQGVKSKYRTHASFAMNSAMFWGEVMGMTDTNGRPIAVADPQSPAKYNVLGFPVIVDDNCSADTIIFGDFGQGYMFNFVKSPDVSRDTSVGFRSGNTVFRAFALADGKPADKNALCVFKRASA